MFGKRNMTRCWFAYLRHCSIVRKMSSSFWHWYVPFSTVSQHASRSCAKSIMRASSPTETMSKSFTSSTSLTTFATSGFTKGLDCSQHLACWSYALQRFLCVLIFLRIPIFYNTEHF